MLNSACAYYDYYSNLHQNSLGVFHCVDQWVFVKDCSTIRYSKTKAWHFLLKKKRCSYENICKLAHFLRIALRFNTKSTTCSWIPAQLSQVFCCHSDEINASALPSSSSRTLSQRTKRMESHLVLGPQGCLGFWERAGWNAPPLRALRLLALNERGVSVSIGNASPGTWAAFAITNRLNTQMLEETESEQPSERGWGRIHENLLRKEVIEDLFCFFSCSTFFSV